MTASITDLRRAYRAANKVYQQAWPRVLKSQAIVMEAQEAYLALAIKMHESESEEFCDQYDAARGNYVRVVGHLAHVERETTRLLDERDAIYRDLVAAEKAA